MRWGTLSTTFPTLPTSFRTTAAGRGTASIARATFATSFRAERSRQDAGAAPRRTSPPSNAAGRSAAARPLLRSWRSTRPRSRSSAEFREKPPAVHAFSAVGLGERACKILSVRGSQLRPLSASPPVAARGMLHGKKVPRRETQPARLLPDREWVSLLERDRTAAGSIMPRRSVLLGQTQGHAPTLTVSGGVNRTASPADPGSIRRPSAFWGVGPGPRGREAHLIEEGQPP
jgi:hypothetical protein